MVMFKPQIILGLLGNIGGMGADLASPLYVGFIIDAVLEKNADKI